MSGNVKVANRGTKINASKHHDIKAANEIKLPFIVS